MKMKINCKTGLKKNVINKNVFDRETDLCKALSKRNKGRCGWGKCEDCGVVPFLVKLHKGKLLEDAKEIEQEKKKYLKSQ